MEASSKTNSLLPNIATQLTCEKVLEDKSKALSAEQNSASTTSPEMQSQAQVYAAKDMDEAKRKLHAMRVKFGVA